MLWCPRSGHHSISDLGLITITYLSPGYCDNEGGKTPRCSQPLTLKRHLPKGSKLSSGGPLKNLKTYFMGLMHFHRNMSKSIWFVFRTFNYITTVKLGTGKSMFEVVALVLWLSLFTLLPAVGEQRSRTASTQKVALSYRRDRS